MGWQVLILLTLLILICTHIGPDSDVLDTDSTCPLSGEAKLAFEVGVPLSELKVVHFCSFCCVASPCDRELSVANTVHAQLLGGSDEDIALRVVCCKLSVKDTVFVIYLTVINHRFSSLSKLCSCRAGV